MGDRLDKGRAPERSSAGLVPPFNGRFHKPGLREMVCHHFRLRFCHRRETVAHGFGNPPMQAMSAALGQALVSGILKEGVLESVTCLRWLAFAEYQLGLLELSESWLQRRSVPFDDGAQQSIGELAPDRGGGLRDLLGACQAIQARHKRIMQCLWNCCLLAFTEPRLENGFR